MMRLNEWTGNRAQGRIPYRATTPGDPPWGRVVLLHEGFGFSEFIFGFQDRLTANGLEVATPALFWRTAILGVDFEDDQEVLRLTGSFDLDHVRQDINDLCTALSWSDELPVFAVGFCYGGAIAFLVGSHPPFSGALAWYPGILRPYADLLGDAAEPQAPMRLHLAEHDRFQPPDERAWQEQLPLRWSNLTLKFFDADHGFCNQHRTDLYSRSAAEDSIGQGLEFLRDIASRTKADPHPNI